MISSRREDGSCARTGFGSTATRSSKQANRQARIAGTSPASVAELVLPPCAEVLAQFVALLKDDVLLDYNNRPLTPAGRHKARFPAGKRLVHGHFRASRYESVQAYWMTFLREPVSNLISVYNYWQSVPEHGNLVH